MNVTSPVLREQDFSAVAQPGVIISNAWPQSRREAGATRKAIEEVLEHFPFFEAFQTVDIPFPEERRAVARLLGEKGRRHTYTLTRVLAERKLNLSSLDAHCRAASCEAVIGQLDEAREAGAQAVGLISGPRPEPRAARVAALEALADSLMKIAEAAERRDLEIVLEPLDTDAHKCCTLGTTVEAVALCERLATAGRGIRLCLDVAHLTLNDEDVVEAVKHATSHVAEFHFCNAVMDRSHPLHGDHHLFFGEPGVIGFREIGQLMAGLAQNGFLSASRRPPVYCEVWKPEQTPSLAVVAHCAEALTTGWRFARTATL
jgi:sugar phosphate isomerase/epimerase